MRLLTTVVVALIGLGAAGCKRKGDAAGANEEFVRLIQGNYTCTGMMMGGKPVPPELLQKVALKYAVRGNELVAFRPTGGEDPIAFRVDTSKTPHWADFTENLDGKERTNAGLMKFENGVLTIVMVGSEAAGDRPTSFDSTGPNAMTLVLKRD